MRRRTHTEAQRHGGMQKEEKKDLAQRRRGAEEERTEEGEERKKREEGKKEETGLQDLQDSPDGKIASPWRAPEFSPLRTLRLCARYSWKSGMSKELPRWTPTLPSPRLRVRNPCMALSRSHLALYDPTAVQAVV
jgi:hypothetical protein